MQNLFNNIVIAYSVDKRILLCYSAHINMKKLIFAVFALVVLAAPARVLAEDLQIICPQPYGGGVVCGVHTPVQTGIADNLLLIGTGFIMASGALLYFSKKIKKTEI